jgi:hypothetical protein
MHLLRSPRNAPEYVPQLVLKHRLALPVRLRHHDAFTSTRAANAPSSSKATGQPPDLGELDPGGQPRSRRLIEPRAGILVP